MHRPFPLRYLLVFWTFGLSVLLYVDRICISAAKEAIAGDFSFDDRQMGWILSVFALGYALCQTPGGWLADRFGPRRVLSAIVLFWSVFTGLTAAAWNFPTMLVIRFLFGAGEAGAFPGVARVTYSWIPMQERGLIQGINFSGSRIGGAASLVLIPAMIDRLGWQASFLLLMGIGCLWAIGWHLWFRDDPSDHPRISPEEIAHIAAHRQHASPVTSSSLEQLQIRRVAEAGPTGRPGEGQESASFRGRGNATSNPLPVAIATSPPTAPPLSLAHLISSRNLWLISLQYFSSNFTFFFCLTWLFPHLKATYQLSGIQAGLYSAAPFLCGAVGNWFAGWLVDRIYRAGHWTASRRNPAVVGFLLGVVGLVGSVQAQTPLSSIAWFSLAIFGTDMTISPSWSFCIDIGKSHAGLISGTMNMAGNLGSFVTALAFPYLAAWTGSNTPFFYIAAGLNLLAVAVWMQVDPRIPLVEAL